MTPTGPPAAGPLDADGLAATLDDLGVDHQQSEPGAFLVTLPGERRHRTLVWLMLGDHHLLVESFVCRAPDENADEVHTYLLRRNAALRSVAYAIDAAGDIHLVGRLSRAAVTAAEVDALLGTVLATSDADFNPILERGFASAIRREWAWRTSTGQSVKNLRAFAHLIRTTGDDGSNGS